MLHEIPGFFIQFGGSFFLLRLCSDVVVNVRSPVALMWSDCLVYWSETNNRDVIYNRWLSVSGSCLHVCGGSFSSSSYIHPISCWCLIRLTPQVDPLSVWMWQHSNRNVWRLWNKCGGLPGTAGSKGGRPASRNKMTGLAWRLMCLVSP